MTRGEEIIKEAELCASANTQIIGDWGEHYLGFIHGAEWADRTMIEKACEWLEEQSCCGYIEDIDVNEFVAQFRKAMQEDKQ